MESGTLTPKPQSAAGVSYAPMLKKEHGYLDLSRPAKKAMNQFRGVTPAPGARVFLGPDPVLVQAMRDVPGGFGEPYTVVEVAGRHLRVAAGDGAVDLITVRPPGKKSMDGSAFARGRRLGPGDCLAPPPATADLGLRVTVAG
jgi:methionyl-tRNA formyltransferase